MVSFFRLTVLLSSRKVSFKDFKFFISKELRNFSLTINLNGVVCTLLDMKYSLKNIIIKDYDTDSKGGSTGLANIDSDFCPAPFSGSVSFAHFCDNPTDIPEERSVI